MEARHQSKEMTRRYKKFLVRELKRVRVLIQEFWGSVNLSLSPENRKDLWPPSGLMGHFSLLRRRFELYANETEILLRATLNPSRRQLGRPDENLERLNS